MKYFLGLGVARFDTETLLIQRIFISDVLKDCEMFSCKPTKFAFSKGLQLTTDKDDSLKNPDQYRRLIGRLLYINLTRPNINNSIQHLS